MSTFSPTTDLQGFNSINQQISGAENSLNNASVGLEAHFNGYSVTPIIQDASEPVRSNLPEATPRPRSMNHGLVLSLAHINIYNDRTSLEDYQKKVKQGINQVLLQTNDFFHEALSLIKKGMPSISERVSTVEHWSDLSFEDRTLSLTEMLKNRSDNTVEVVQQQEVFKILCELHSLKTLSEVVNAGVAYQCHFGLAVTAAAQKESFPLLNFYHDKGEVISKNIKKFEKTAYTLYSLLYYLQLNNLSFYEAIAEEQPAEITEPHAKASSYTLDLLSSYHQFAEAASSGEINDASRFLKEALRNHILFYESYETGKLAYYQLKQREDTALRNPDLQKQFRKFGEITSHAITYITKAQQAVDKGFEELATTTPIREKKIAADKFFEAAERSLYVANYDDNALLATTNLQPEIALYWNAAGNSLSRAIAAREKEREDLANFYDQATDFYTKAVSAKNNKESQLATYWSSIGSSLYQTAAAKDSNREDISKIYQQSTEYFNKAISSLIDDKFSLAQYWYNTGMCLYRTAKSQTEQKEEIAQLYQQAAELFEKAALAKAASQSALTDYCDNAAHWLCCAAEAKSRNQEDLATLYEQAAQYYEQASNLLNNQKLSIDHFAIDRELWKTAQETLTQEAFASAVLKRAEYSYEIVQAIADGRDEQPTVKQMKELIENLKKDLNFPLN